MSKYWYLVAGRLPYISMHELTSVGQASECTCVVILMNV